MEQVVTILVAVISGGGIGYVINYKTNTLSIIQKIYKEFVVDVEKEMGQLKQEVFMLSEIVRSYKSVCDNCPHYQQQNRLRNEQNNNNR